MSENAISLSLDEATLTKMRSFYADSLEEPTSDTIDFTAKQDEVRITVYKKSKNGLRKVLFQGSKARYEASIWGEVPEEAPVTALAKAFGDQIGSDEVGVGDFFGPVIVVAAYASKAQLKRLRELGVTDSKKMDDDTIRSLGPTLLHEFDYSQLHLPVEKYNEVVSSGLNLNAIKAKMHNRALLNVYKRHPGTKVYQDQFAAPKTYFGYLKGETEILSSIVFATKGESKFPCVALASVIARYSFLLKMDALNESYGVAFPFGAGSAVDEFAREFLEKHGEAELRKVAKVHFANFKRLIG